MKDINIRGARTLYYLCNFSLSQKVFLNEKFIFKKENYCFLHIVALRIS